MTNLLKSDVSPLDNKDCRKLSVSRNLEKTPIDWFYDQLDIVDGLDPARSSSDGISAVTGRAIFDRFINLKTTPVEEHAPGCRSACKNDPL